MRTLLAAAILLAALPARAMDMGGNAADKANMRAMETMQHDMPAKGTGDPDRDFVTMMIPHHQGAIDMAEVELRYGKDPALRRLARGVIAAQRREIAVMRDWLARHPAR